MRWTRITEKEIELIDSIGDSGFAIRLYHRLKLYAGSDGKAFPLQTRLAADMGVSKQMIGKAIKKLEGADLVKRERKGKRIVFALRHHPDENFDLDMYHTISSKRMDRVNPQVDRESTHRLTEVNPQVDPSLYKKNTNKKDDNISLPSTVSKRDDFLKKDELLIADLLGWYPDLPKGLAVIASRWLGEEWCLITKRLIEDSPVTRNPVAVFISKLKDMLGGDPKLYNVLRKTQRGLDGKPISHENTIKRMHLHDEAEKED